MAERRFRYERSPTGAEIESIGIPDFFTLAGRANLIDLNDVPDPVRLDVATMLERARELSDQLDGRMLLDNDFTSDNMILDGEMSPLLGVSDFSGLTAGPASFDFRQLLHDPGPLAANVTQSWARGVGIVRSGAPHHRAGGSPSVRQVFRRTSPGSPFLQRAAFGGRTSRATRPPLLRLRPP